MAKLPIILFLLLICQEVNAELSSPLSNSSTIALETDMDMKKANNEDQLGIKQLIWQMGVNYGKMEKKLDELEQKLADEKKEAAGLKEEFAKLGEKIRELEKRIEEMAITKQIDEFEWINYDGKVYKMMYVAPDMTISNSKEQIIMNSADEPVWNSVRADLPIPSFNLNDVNKPRISFYFEMQILTDISNLNSVAIGFCDQQYVLEGKHLGLENSIGVWRKNEILIDRTSILMNGRLEYFKQWDIVGVGIIYQPNSNIECFATCNGEFMGKVGLPAKFANIQLFPAVALYLVGEPIRVNFEKDKWLFKEFGHVLD